MKSYTAIYSTKSIVGFAYSFTSTPENVLNYCDYKFGSSTGIIFVYEDGVDEAKFMII